MHATGIPAHHGFVGGIWLDAPGFMCVHIHRQIHLPADGAAENTERAVDEFSRPARPLWEPSMTSPQLHRLYDSHAQAMYACAIVLLRDEADARDVLQDVFLRVAERGMADVKHDRAWLLRTVHHAAVDLMRRNSVRRRHDEPPPLFATVEDPDTAALRTALTMALDSLPPEQRAVVHLKLWEGLTFEQIATLLEISPNTASSRYRYALERLRPQLRHLYLELT